MPTPLGNKLIKVIIQSPFHRLAGNNIGVISVTGCRTGKIYATPINIFPMGDSLFATSRRDRTWWRNLRQKCQASLQLSGEKWVVRAEVIEMSLEVKAKLRAFFCEYPHLAKFYKMIPDTSGNLDDHQLDGLSENHVVIVFHQV